MKDFDKQELTIVFIIIFCAIAFFFLGDYYEKRAIVLGVVATIIYMLIYSEYGNW